MKLSAAPSNSSGSKPLTVGQERAARVLFYSGWVITLMYLLSGLLHQALGAGVYARDVLLGIHLCADLYWMVKTGRSVTFARRSWLLLVPAIFVLPAIFNGNARVEALTFVKWTAFWLDWAIMGNLALAVIKVRNVALIILGALTGLFLIADLGAGAYERATDTYIFDTRGELSAFGVTEGKEMMLGTHLRAKGLERDVFAFANIMAMSSLLGLFIFVSVQIFWLRFAGLMWSAAFCIGLFVSGGRSALFGVFAAGLAAAGLLLAPDWIRKYWGRITLAWLVIGLTISFLGVGRLTEAIGGSVMQGSRVGNSDSAYERDANWTGIVDAMEDVPIVLVSGGPLASMLDPKVEPIYHWADNQYLWLIYHSGLAGFIAVLIYFYNLVRMYPAGGRIWLHDGMILFLLFVMGEAIARESLTFIGCMPLFVAAGCHEIMARGNESRTKPKSPSRSSRNETKAASDVSDFNRRVRAATRRRE